MAKQAEKTRYSAEAAVRLVDPHNLKNHLLSVEIYGDATDTEDFTALKESIQRNGILQPIIVAADGETVVAGHRRKSAARILGLPEVPVIVRQDLTDPLEIESAVLESNRQRIKTPEQIGREYIALERIERQRARQRQATSTGGSDPQLRPNSDEAEKPGGKTQTNERSDDIAATKLGIGKTKARNAATVVEAIDKAEQAGDVERAEQIRTATTVNEAYQLAQGKPSEEELDPIEEAAMRLKGSAKTIEMSRVNIDVVVDLVGKHRSRDRIMKLLDDVLIALKEWARDLQAARACNQEAADDAD